MGITCQISHNEQQLKNTIKSFLYCHLSLIISWSLNQFNHVECKNIFEIHTLAEEQAHTHEQWRAKLSGMKKSGEEATENVSRLSCSMLCPRLRLAYDAWLQVIHLTNQWMGSASGFFGCFQNFQWMSFSIFCDILTAPPLNSVTRYSIILFIYKVFSWSTMKDYRD